MIRILLSACQMKGVKLWTRLVVFWDATRYVRADCHYVRSSVMIERFTRNK